MMQPGSDLKCNCGGEIRVRDSVVLCEHCGYGATISLGRMASLCKTCAGIGLANVVDPEDGALVIDDCPECGGESVPASLNAKQDDAAK